jgi:hypothetical protein
MFPKKPGKAAQRRNMPQYAAICRQKLAPPASFAFRDPQFAIPIPHWHITSARKTRNTRYTVDAEGFNVQQNPQRGCNTPATFPVSANFEP